jgi:hypothetical protein
MFQGLFKRAETTIDQVVGKYVGRAIVAIPLLVAGGFATAALTVKLVQLYEPVTGYSIMAALFAVIGLLTAVATGVGTATEGVSQTQEAVSESSDASPGDSEAETLLTPDVMAILTSAAPIALPGIARGIGRNLPLVFILAVLAFIVSHFAEPPPESTGEGHENTEAEPAVDPVTAPPAAA